MTRPASTTSSPVVTLSPVLSTGEILGIIIGIAVVIFVLLLLLVLVLGIGTIAVKKKMRVSPSYSASFLNCESPDLEGRASRPSSAMTPTAPPQTFCRPDPPPAYDEVVATTTPNAEMNGTEHLINSTTL